MSTLKREVPVELYIEPKEAARLFWESDDGWQADFFNALHEVIHEKEGIGALAMQLEYVIQADSLLSDDGKRIMQLIGDYGYTERLTTPRRDPRIRVVPRKPT